MLSVKPLALLLCKEQSSVKLVFARVEFPVDELFLTWPVAALIHLVHLLCVAHICRGDDLRIAVCLGLRFIS